MTASISLPKPALRHRPASVQGKVEREVFLSLCFDSAISAISSGASEAKQIAI